MALVLAWMVSAMAMQDLGGGTSSWSWLNMHPVLVVSFVCVVAINFAVISRPDAAPYFRYDPRPGRIRARDRWGVWQVHPRRGYERLEYSVAHGEIWEVATDGGRRKLPIAAAWAHRADWQEFVESFHPYTDVPVAIRHVPRAHSERAQAPRPPGEEVSDEA